jgi:hypothetical protein
MMHSMDLPDRDRKERGVERRGEKREWNGRGKVDLSRSAVYLPA